MKSLTIKLILIFLVFLHAVSANAQEGDFADIFRGTPDDAALYLENYVSPAMLSFSNGMAAGWYNTAKTHKPFGMDLSFSLNVANMPTSERLFSFNPSEYNFLRVKGASGNTEMPTLVGGSTSEILMVQTTQSIEIDGVTYQYEQTKEFDAPGGFDVEDVPFVGVPAPTLQLGIGIFKNTDIKLRFVPEQNFEDYSVKMFGIGVLHDVKQWIPGIRQVPIDISIFAGTTKLQAEYHFEGGDDDGIDWEVKNGLAEFEATASTFQAVVSKKISFFTPYFGIGFNTVSTSLVVNGDYKLFRLTDVNNTSNYFQYQTVSGNDDPVMLNFNGGGGMRTTLGFRLKFFILTLNADYTIQKYNTLSLGLGFTFRENS
ncbi:DUF6588 family protein [Reichenbachiella sp. MALMAid0571]|uniref:DUF6588 family protein n=1 Tax=Reichenbachiella sp. MALMAid0571 TaxID=3143939 RepID=UPI0032DED65F